MKSAQALHSIHILSTVLCILLYIILYPYIYIYIYMYINIYIYIYLRILYIILYIELYIVLFIALYSIGVAGLKLCQVTWSAAISIRNDEMVGLGSPPTLLHIYPMSGVLTCPSTNASALHHQINYNSNNFQVYSLRFEPHTRSLDQLTVVNPAFKAEYSPGSWERLLIGLPKM